MRKLTKKTATEKEVMEFKNERETLSDIYLNDRHIDLRQFQTIATDLTKEDMEKAAQRKLVELQNLVMEAGLKAYELKAKYKANLKKLKAHEVYKAIQKTRKDEQMYSRLTDRLLAELQGALTLASELGVKFNKETSEKIKISIDGRKR